MPGRDLHPQFPESKSGVLLFDHPAIEWKWELRVRPPRLLSLPKRNLALWITQLP